MLYHPPPGAMVWTAEARKRGKAALAQTPPCGDSRDAGGCWCAVLVIALAVLLEAARCAAGCESVYTFGEGCLVESLDPVALP